ncbi:dapper homolog 3 [Alosa sapidissima]|uniref:dapper homolog 3 n=1 Tax=Alosa sapidissima TaxID=34773 RepID=UPI001C094664|nr:dapper homolog 3 [Alosa sapidissima]
MYCGFSLPMTTERRQNKERLEASLAWLCELELLKQRQESLVLNALSLGDIVPGQPAWGDLQPARSTQSDVLREQEDLTLRRQLNSLQGAPWGLMLALEQQLRELGLEQSSPLSLPPPPLLPATVCDEASEDEDEDEADSRPSSGFYEQSESLSPPGGPPTTWASSHHRPKSVDCSLLNGEEAREPSPRAMLPRSHSAPFSPLEDIAEGTGEEEEVEEDEPWPEAPELDTTEEDIQQALRVEAYILSLLQRRALRPRQTQYPPAATGRGLTTSASFPVRPPHPITVPAAHATEAPPDPAAEPQEWVASEEVQSDAELAQALEQYYLSLLYPTSRPASLAAAAPLVAPPPQQYAGAMEPSSYSSTDPESLQSNPDYGEPYPLVAEQLLTVNYVPVEHPHPHPHPHHCSPFHGKHKPSRASFSGGQLPPPPARSSPCRGSGGAEARSSPRGTGKKRTTATATTTTTAATSRSRSENSLQAGGGGWGRYYTVQRDMARARRQVQGQDEPPHHQQRRWCSTADLSQEEEEAAGGGGGGGGAHPHPHAHPRQAWPPPPPLCAQYGGPERGDEVAAVAMAAAAAVAPVPVQAAGGGSDSSLSEAYSPGSSSFTSDSDESGGGLVWPQEVPPRLASSPPPALSSVVKIKASHALKKKIMRFRSGSLKVMTTV